MVTAYFKSKHIFPAIQESGLCVPGQRRFEYKQLLYASGMISVFVRTEYIYLKDMRKQLVQIVLV